MKMTVVGTGVIGNGWIARMLAQGHDVMATDPSEGAEDRMRRAVDQAWPYVEALGLAEGASKERLTFKKELPEAVKDADFIQENVPEVEELKQTVLKNIDQHAKADAIIGSSTSGIMPSDLQANLQHPERFVVAHPFHPVYILPLVEVVPGKQTTPENVEKATSIYEGLQMSVLHVRNEIEGHIADRLIEAIWRESLHIVNEGIATTEEVDKAFTHGAGLRYAQYGPFLTFHLAGGEGGMRHMLKQFGPALKKPWTKLEAPELTDELYDKVVSGCEHQSNGMTMSELDKNRNEFLIRLYDLVQEYWPKETKKSQY
jgi:carnitine 3-dehydrogenase